MTTRTMPTTRGPGRPMIGAKAEVRLPPAVLERIDAEAERRDVRRAELMREVLEAYAADLPEPKPKRRSRRA